MTTPAKASKATTPAEPQGRTAAELVAHAAVIARLRPGTPIVVRPPGREPITGYKIAEAIYNSWESLIDGPEGQRVRCATQWIHPVEAAQ